MTNPCRRHFQRVTAAVAAAAVAGPAMTRDTIQTAIKIVDQHRENTRYLHPAVLQALQSVVRDAHAEGKPASICGEMARNPCPLVAHI